MDIFALLDGVQAIARSGLSYDPPLYDRERYERLLELCAQSYAELLDLPAEAIRSTFLKEMGQITPKVGADAAIFNQQGELLLMERSDGSGWCLPCGWVEPNERPADAILREVREETGLEVNIQRLVGVFTRMPGGKHGLHTMIAILHLCEVTGGCLKLSHEGLDLKYWPLAEVPHWHANHARLAQAAFEMWQPGGMDAAISD